MAARAASEVSTEWAEIRDVANPFPALNTPSIPLVFQPVENTFNKLTIPEISEPTSNHSPRFLESLINFKASIKFLSVDIKIYVGKYIFCFIIYF